MMKAAGSGGFFCARLIGVRARRLQAFAAIAWRTGAVFGCTSAE